VAEPAIVVEDLTYTYGALRAVDGVSFTVGRGEIVGFLGPNGAGKTTTVKVLTGQLRPASGRASVLGFDTVRETEQIHRRIGVSFESTNLYEQMSAQENLELFARLFDVRGFDAPALLARVGLAGRERERAANYSKGMKQRLMVARSLVNTPELLFLDEPTAGLDPTSAASIRQLIRQERERGATVFLTTHDMAEADELCDRVAFMNQGRIAALDTPLALKRAHGRRALRARVAVGERLEEREITLDEPGTADAVRALFASEQVVTVHSEEATLAEVFISVTGRRLEQ
jgi:ABC-2 type transport system ATP-binding protein